MYPTTVRLGGVVLLALVIGACVSSGIRPLPAPRMTDTVVRQLEVGWAIVVPGSSRVEPNVRYAYRLSTHCGLPPQAFDFDGSFWRVVGPPQYVDGVRPPAWADPVQDGVMTLVGAEEATFYAEGVELRLERSPEASLEIFLCI